MVLMLQLTSGPSFAQSVVRDVRENRQKKLSRDSAGKKHAKARFAWPSDFLLDKFQSNYTYPIGFFILTSSHYRLLSITSGDVLNKIALLFE